MILIASLKSLPARISTLVEGVVTRTCDVSVHLDDHDDRLEIVLDVAGTGPRNLGLTFEQADELRKGLHLALEAMRLRQLARTHGLACAICKLHHPAGAAHAGASP